MSATRIFYLKNHTLPVVESLLLHLKIGNITVQESEKDDDFSQDFFISENFDLILCDYPYSNRNVYKNITECKAKSAIPLLFLVTNFKESTQIAAFKEGADDVIDRTLISDRVITLISRMNNLIEIYSQNQNKAVKSWKAGEIHLSIDSESRQVLVDGTIKHLTPTEWNILILLTGKNGQVVPREDILAHCFEYQYEGYDRSIDAHIKNLRKKIAGGVETVRGVGYRFQGDEIKPIER